MKLEFSKQNICIESTLHHFQKILRYPDHTCKNDKVVVIYWYLEIVMIIY